LSVGLFRLALPNGSIRLARGTVGVGPAELLAADLTVAAILQGGASRLAEVVLEDPDEGPVPAAARVLAPVDDQEVWAAGVTYERSRDARMEESTEASVYDHVYGAVRPELFFKAPGWRVRGPAEAVGIRRDSEWNVPEPELALVIASDLTIAGYTLGNDLSSRTIEGENPLYLPQAKVYDGSCALGPALVPAASAAPPFALRLVVTRNGAVIVDESTTTARIRRPLEELVGFLGRALELPNGAILLTGTGIVPDASFTLLNGDLVRIEGSDLGVLENPVRIVGGLGAASPAASADSADAAQSSARR
jgi:2-dehydro-3-deoxy-D-arabinonate dehydratase